MKVIVIVEESHGFIGVAKDFDAAVNFLNDKYWLSGDSNIYDEKKKEWTTVKEMFGKDWLAYFHFNCNIEQFNDFFDGCFYLREETMYE